MSSRSISIITLRDYAEQGYEITAFCRHDLHCLHWGKVNLGSVIQRFGWDFSVPAGRPRLLAALVCSKCGRHFPQITIGHADRTPGSYAVGYGETISSEEALRREVKRRAEWRERVMQSDYAEYETRLLTVPPKKRSRRRR